MTKHVPVVRGRKSWGRSTITLLHAPRFMFILCFMIIGTFMSPIIDFELMMLEVVAVSVAVLLTAYSLDELKGRHCGTCIHNDELKFRAIFGLCVSVSIGVYIIYVRHWSLLIWAVIGLIGVVFYNFEIGGNKLHNVWVFGFTWGFVPVCASYYMQTLTLTLSVVCIGVFAIVVARLHLWSYGHTRCYHSDVCLDFARIGGIDKCMIIKCHGMSCGYRLDMPYYVHKLAWTLIQAQFWTVALLTLAIVAWERF